MKNSTQCQRLKLLLLPAYSSMKTQSPRFKSVFQTWGRQTFTSQMWCYPASFEVSLSDRRTDELCLVSDPIPKWVCYSCALSKIMYPYLNSGKTSINFAKGYTYLCLELHLNLLSALARDLSPPCDVQAWLFPPSQHDCRKHRHSPI